MANFEKGRPHLFGNKSQRGRPKPPRSGTPKIAEEEIVNFTFRIPRSQLDRLKREAKTMNLSAGCVLRGAIADYFDEGGL